MAMVATAAQTLQHNLISSCSKPSRHHPYKTSYTPHTFFRNISYGISSRNVSIKTHSSSSSSAAAETLYEVLGISGSIEGLSCEDIKQAYRKMARKYHPNVSPPESVDEYTKKFILLHDAYQTLSSDPRTRALYDRNLLSNFFNSPSGVKYHRRHHQEKEEWRMRWLSQLEGLRKRSNNCSRTI